MFPFSRFGNGAANINVLERVIIETGPPTFLGKRITLEGFKKKGGRGGERGNFKGGFGAWGVGGGKKGEILVITRGSIVCIYI